MEDFSIGNGAGVMNVAAARGDLKSIEYILNRSSSRGISYDFYAAPLRLADQYGQAKVASLLWRKIADMSGHRLIKAAKHGRFNEVRTLVLMGVDVNSKTKTDWTSLHYAAKFGHLFIVKYLIAKGADVNSRGVGGQTPLFEAAFYGNMEMAKILVDEGADVSVRGYGGMTPVRAAFANRHSSVAHYLLTKGGF